VLPQQMFCRQSATDVRVSAERNRLTPVSVTTRQSSARIAWDVAGQTPMNERDVVVADALPHWKPVQLAKHR